jgi:hypothetical protein
VPDVRREGLGLSALRDALRRDVETLAGEIGERNLEYEEYRDNLVAAAKFVERSFAAAGYDLRRQEYTIDGAACRNLEVEIPGTDPGAGIVVVGAHYDSVTTTARRTRPTRSTTSARRGWWPG